MPFASAADGAQIAYSVTGQGEALLLISGQSLDHTMWDGITPALAANFRVITFDNRGTGSSDKPEGEAYSTKGFAMDAVAVLDAAGAARAHVYGFSMGGRIAQWLAIGHASRVGALILGATSPGGPHAVQRMADVERRIRTGGLAAVEAEFYSPSYLSAHPGVFAPPPIPAMAQLLHYRASQAHDSWAELPSINAPTLIIHGTADRMNPTANAALLAARIPGAEMMLIDGARHGYIDEYRTEALQAVIAFLARHPIA